MRVAVTMHVGFSHESNDTLNHTYIGFLEEAGLQPVLVPNAIRDAPAYARHLDVEGLVLTGGNDVLPRRCGGEGGERGTVSVRRNTIEMDLLRMALADDLPVLGICRGMQFINVFFAGGLVHDVVSTVESAIDHVGRPHLNAFTDPDMVRAFAAEEFEEFMVNSFHRHGVSRTTLAPRLEAFSVSQSDDLVEGIISRVHPVLGIQWHPERPGGSAVLDLQLIEGVFSRSFWRDGRMR